jgi:hypothetical protein
LAKWLDISLSGLNKWINQEKVRPESVPGIYECSYLLFNAIEKRENQNITLAENAVNCIYQENL